MKRADGRDDPQLAQTSWPLPTSGLEHDLRYSPDTADLLSAAEVVSAYRALIEDGTDAQQIRRLRALRRIVKRQRGVTP